MEQSMEQKLQFTYQSKFCFLTLSQIKLKTLESTTQVSPIHISQKFNLLQQHMGTGFCKDDELGRICQFKFCSWPNIVFWERKLQLPELDQIVQHNPNILFSGPKFLRVELGETLHSPNPSLGCWSILLHPFLCLSLPASISPEVLCPSALLP